MSKRSHVHALAEDNRKRAGELRNAFTLKRASRKLNDIYSHLDRQLPVDDAPDFRRAVNFTGSSQDSVHRWFRYREGFSPSILETVQGCSTVYDPFCGCGTTLIEAKRRALNAVGTDINPLALFVARVKTRVYASPLLQVFDKASAAAIRGSRRKTWTPPPMPLLPKLFQVEALEELAAIRGSIGTVHDEHVRDLLILCWLNILERCSNIFKEGNGLKYRNKKRRPGAYETIPDAVWIPQYFGPSIREFVRNRWKQQCSTVLGDLASISQGTSSSRVEDFSCLDPNVVDIVGSCDAAVFSPPYANRFDYFEAFKLELWMGEFVASGDELRRLRQRSMRNNLTVSDGTSVRLPALESLLAAMDKDSSSVQMGIQNTLRGYFDDALKLAQNLHRIIRPGGKLACVVGNSAYAGVLIPTDSLTALLFQHVGFVVESVSVARHLTVSSQQRASMPQHLQQYMRESVILCRR